MLMEKQEHADARRRNWQPGLLLFVVLLLLGKALIVQSRGGLQSREGLASVLVELLPAGLLLLPIALLQSSRSNLARVSSAFLLSVLSLIWLLGGLTLQRTGALLDPGMILFVLGSPNEVIPAVISGIRLLDIALILTIPLLLLALAWRGSPSRTGMVLCGALILVGAAARFSMPAWQEHPKTATSLIRGLLPSVERTRPVVSAQEGRLLPSPSGYWQAWRRPPPGGPRPNYLVIFLESVRAQATTPYNPALRTTPFLDAWAKRSLVVEEAYAFTNGTAKEMLVAFTGHPPQLVREHVEAGHGPTGGGVPKELVRQGYHTSFFYPALEFHEGQLLAMEDFGFQEHFSGPRLARAFPDALEFARDKNVTTEVERSYYGYDDRSLVKPILSWIRAHKQEPWLLAALTLTSHHPYRAPASWKRQDFGIEDARPHADDYRNYLNSIAYLDDVLRELMTQLETEGLLENTIVILAGYHGESFMENGVLQHGTGLDEYGVRIPLILHGPEKYLGPPRRVQGLRSILDLVPTMAQINGMEMGQPLDSPLVGRSLLRAVPEDRALFLHCWLKPKFSGLFIRKKRYLWDEALDRLDLIDLERDPMGGNSLGREIPLHDRKTMIGRMLACREAVQRFYTLGAERERRALRRKSLPRFPREPGNLIAGKVTLEGVSLPSTVGIFANAQLTLGFEVHSPLPEDTRLELSYFQNGKAVPAATVQDPNRLAPGRWSAGDRILLPIHLYFPSYLVREGPLQIRLRLRSARMGVLAPRTSPRTAEGWIDLGSIQVAESSYLPPPRTRAEVLAWEMEPESEENLESYLHHSTQELLALLPESEVAIRALAHRYQGNPETLVPIYRKASPSMRQALGEVLGAIGIHSVPALLTLLDSTLPTQAEPAANALRSIGTPAIYPIVEQLKRMPRARVQRILPWIRGLDFDYGSAFPDLLVKYLGKDPEGSKSALILLSLSGSFAVPHLETSLPVLSEGQDLEQLLELIEILGTQSQPLIPALERRAKDASPVCKKRIQETITKIE